MPHRSWRRSIEALASVCVAAVVMSACSSGGGDRHWRSQRPTPESTRAAAPALDVTRMQEIADELRAGVPCGQPDALQDDLAFWDSMRGFDCLDDEASTFIRVYAHAASVPQTLQDWDGTFNEERTVARGANWYVVGPPSRLAALRAPSQQPQLAADIGVPSPLTPEQDYLTTCGLFVSTEAERYIREPSVPDESRQQYEALFPGVAAELHSAIDALGPEHVRSITDEDRWAAALSPIGPRVKHQCQLAHRQVGDRVQSLEGD